MLKFMLTGFIGLFVCIGFVIAQQNPENKAISKIPSAQKLSPLQISIKRGLVIYKKQCLSCHQEDGSGVPGMAPSLTRARSLLRIKSDLIELVLKGVVGNANTGNEVYKNPMASFSHLTDRQIADVLTYIRNSFDNKIVAVNAAEVKVVRAKIK